MFILDEATNALDSLNENKIIKLLVELKKKGKNVILITHRTGNLAKADVVYTFGNGEVISEQSKV